MTYHHHDAPFASSQCFAEHLAVIPLLTHYFRLLAEINAQIPENKTILQSYASFWQQMQQYYLPLLTHATEQYEKLLHTDTFQTVYGYWINNHLKMTLAEQPKKQSLHKQMQQFHQMKDRLQTHIGLTPKELIWQQDNIRLYHYQPQSPARPRLSIPILIVFALVNRPYILDLTDEVSFIKKLLREGLDVYLVDWGDPTTAEKKRPLSYYITTYLRNCVTQTLQHSHSQQLNLLGICQGGVFSLCYASLFPTQIKNLITMVTPVDFHTADNMVTKLFKKIDIQLLKKISGNFPGNLLNQFFISLKPFQLLGEKYLNFFIDIQDKNKTQRFLQMENWIFDTPNQPKLAFHQFIEKCYQQNQLSTGKLRIGNKKIQLAHLTMPILNIGACDDHIVPLSSVRALQTKVSTKDYTFRSFAGGHIGLYVSTKTQKKLVPTITRWLKKRV